MTNKTIPVFFSSDNNYVPYMAVSITSLMKNASKDYHYDIVILYSKITDVNLKILQNLENETFTIKLIKMDDKAAELTKTSTDNLCTDYYSLSIYFRLFIPVMFPEYDRGIYLDSDIAVVGDISQLYFENLDGMSIGAITDQSVQKVPPFIQYIEKGLGVPVKTYVNSGILLMDLKQLRDMNFSARFLEVLNKYHFETVAPDQDYLNVLCQKKIKILSPQWNAMSSNDIKDIKEPKIIHYNLFGKPWRYDHITYEEIFWEYAKACPYYEQIVNYKKNYPDKKRKLAEKYLQEMLDKAIRVSEAEINFAYYFTSGKEKYF